MSGGGLSFPRQTGGFADVKGGTAWLVGAGWGAPVGRPEGHWAGLGVGRFTAGVAVASDIVHAGRPLSSISMSASLSEEDQGGALARGGWASGRRGRTGLAPHYQEKAFWWSPQLGQ